MKSLKVTVLSTLLADRAGLGEWGYSALAEVDGRKFLFDTGANPDLVLKNAKSPGIDLSDVEDVVISHNHDPKRTEPACSCSAVQRVIQRLARQSAASDPSGKSDRQVDIAIQPNVARLKLVLKFAHAHPGGGHGPKV